MQGGGLDSRMRWFGEGVRRCAGRRDAEGSPQVSVSMDVGKRGGSIGGRSSSFWRSQFVLRLRKLDCLQRRQRESRYCQGDWFG